jgi:type I restriction enzyme, S subunit
MSLPRYPAYKDSGLDWLGKVPSHWEILRLKYRCEVFPSNVDMHSRDDEPAVRLCNYTDVYYNERITPDMEFMEATASPDQIARFTLKAGDTIITKDSETAEDIAIAAYVPQDLPGVVCGYHLSMVRPKEATSGAFVKRLFDSFYAKARLAVAANGLTRVGLGQYALDNVELPFPPHEEQATIATFLDRETAKIDALIAEQDKLIALLAEKRRATISHAVTRGLNPDAPMKESGVAWLGQVPAHWGTGTLTRIAERVVVGIAEAATHAYQDDGVPILRSTNIRAGRLVGEVLHIAPAFAAERGSKLISAGDLVTVRTGNAGVTAVVPPELDQCQCFTMLITTLQPTHSPNYYCYWMNSEAAVRYFQVEGWGTAQVNISVPILKALPIVIPPSLEQAAIAEFLGAETARLDRLKRAADRTVALLKERRSALIAAAVTGQIDIREQPHSQPRDRHHAPAALP